MLDTDDSVAIMPTSPGLYKCVLESVIYFFYVEKEDPQPHVVLALGFFITNCAPSRPS